MAVDSREASRNYPIPNVANKVSEEFPRIITSLTMIGTDVQSALAQLAGKATLSHTHTIANVTGLQTALDGKAAATHSHTLDDLSDVAATGATNLQVLAFVSGTWQPYSLSVSSVSGLQGAIDTAVANSAATLAPLDSPALTGAPTAPTQTAGNNSTRLATTAFVQAAVQAGALPSQTGNGNKALFTNGTTASWQQVFPTQTSKAGQALFTDGTNPYWSVVVQLSQANTWTAQQTFQSSGQAAVLQCSTDNPYQVSFYTNGVLRGYLGANSTYPFYVSRPSDAASLLYLSGSGDLTAVGNVGAYSDRRLKDNIRTIDGALALVERMRGVRYTRIDTDAPRVGVIAQEMREVVPEAVMGDGVGMLAVSYGDLVGVLIEAVKELSAQVRELQAARG
ncbi:MAG: tail fiber domain-containing protein [Alsobacter sp.]